jgi:hypothetical protein
MQLEDEQEAYTADIPVSSAVDPALETLWEGDSFWQRLRAHFRIRPLNLHAMTHD